MAIESRRFWNCFILLAAVGCDEPPATRTPERVVDTRIHVEHEDVQADEDVRSDWQLQEDRAEAALEIDQPLLPLRNFPVVLETVSGERNTLLTVKNVGDSTLIFRGSGSPNGPIIIEQFREHQHGRYWLRPEEQWNCLSFPKFELAPGTTVRLSVRFSNSEKRERILGFFRQKGTSRGCRVVLATQPDH